MSGTARPSIDLDGGWRFIPDPELLHEPDGLPDGVPIRVPGVWEAQLENPWGIVHGWYRRRFQVPSEWAGQPVLLRFGAVMYRCRAWVNGRPVGEHEGGYTAFSFHVGEQLRAGWENELVLLVTNPLNVISNYPALSVDEVLRHQELFPEVPLSEAPHGKQTWYASMSGPWKSVRLERVQATYLAGLRMLPDARAGRATARWRLAGEPPAGGTQLQLSIVDPDGREVAAESRPLEAGQREGEWRLDIPSPRLWDIGQPNLYRATLAVAPGRADEDRSLARFGMRDIRIREGRILLNERPIYLLAALDQDVYPDTIWSAPSREFLTRQVAQARQMGLNMLRCHIKVPDPAYVEAADEAGLLLWCELPNWTVFSQASAERGRRTLEAMVEELGNSPSIVAWTIINEDWGTELRDRARDRHWLRREAAWLRELDPTRLVVDNSACNTAHGPNFHLLSDLADFHVYYGIPDNAPRWRGAIEQFAGRPAWLWSPHGDAQPTGEEPLVLSEFGNWGLPRLDRLVEHYGRDPWWFDTGRHYYRPRGLARRFKALGLDRLWSSVDELAEATQWHQFEALRYEIGQLRRHGSIQGYVITELTDAFWEANGLLDITRGEKVFHDRLAQLNADDVIVADLERADAWDDRPLRARLYLSSYGPPSTAGGRLAWRLALADGQQRAGELTVTDWPRFGVQDLGWLEVDLPSVSGTTDARLELACFDEQGHERARDAARLAVLPGALRSTANPLSVAIHDPLDVWSLGDRIEQLGHRRLTMEEASRADVLLASELTPELVAQVEAGKAALVLIRDRSALPAELSLARRIQVQPRHLAQPGAPGQQSPWGGDWIGSFSWLLPGQARGLPDRRLLDMAYAQVVPDHVLLGYDSIRHRDEVSAGMFVGWVHAPAALLWRFGQGRGTIAATTLRLSPEDGPVASALLEGLLQDLGGQREPRTDTLAEVRA